MTSLAPAPLYCGAILLLLCASCSTSRPPKRIRLPAVLSEASGLVIEGDRMIWHNDSGDGPYLYRTDLRGALLGRDTLDAGARDYEDICAAGDTLYVGDFGNNRGLRRDQRVYLYDREGGGTDSIVFTYPGQSGTGRFGAGDYNCEAMVVAGGYLHLFTKDALGAERDFYIRHFRLPDRPGHYVAEFVDSLYLPRRVVTGAALDATTRTLYLTAYNYRKLFGFLPVGGASLITLTGYPAHRFLAGKLRRRNLAWAIPTQQEAVGVYDGRYLYVAAEATPLRRRAVARRIKR